MNTEHFHRQISKFCFVLVLCLMTLHSGPVSTVQAEVISTEILSEGAALETSALRPGSFVPFGGQTDFRLRVKNTGNLGVDTYDLTSSISSWPVTYYQSNGLTPLKDTDSDNMIDTGPIAAGAFATIVARYSTPPGAVVGDSNFPAVRFASSLSPRLISTVRLGMSIPAGFVTVFANHADHALSFLTASSDGTNLYKLTPNNYWGDQMAVTQLMNGNYFYVWRKNWNIEYALVDPHGHLLRPPTQLTDNGSTGEAAVFKPSVAVAPSGIVGVTWIHELWKNDPYPSAIHSDVFFATLSSAGDLLTGPTNVTNNPFWGDLFFHEPTIASTSDNRFVLGWKETRQGDIPYKQNLWYCVLNTDGISILPPTALTSNDHSWEPILNHLIDGKVIITWKSNQNPYYAIINSDGSLSRQATLLGAEEIWSAPDAVQLPNGKVALAWTTDSDVAFVILNANYDVESGPHYAASPYFESNFLLSATTDASSRVIMIWRADNYNNLLYALGDSTGAFLTKPMVYYHSSQSYMELSWNGQGNAPYQASPIISGNVGVADASLSHVNSSTIADGSGKYSFKVPLGWGGTITPWHSCFTFNPASRDYSNVTMDQESQTYTPQLIPGSGCAHINVEIAGVHKTIAGIPHRKSTRISLAGVDNGPVKIESTNTVPIVGSERTIHKLSGVPISFSEMMGLPARQLDTTYWLPWYNNVDLQTQLRFANISETQATTHVFIGGVEMTGSPFTLGPGESTRKSFAGVNDGPVMIQSSAKIVAAERVIYRVNGFDTSFSEMMALPDNQLSTTYWLPWYNNLHLDTQLRVANVSDQQATVHVYIGATEMVGSPFDLAPGTSTRTSFAGVNGGPVKIESNANLVAAERVIYKVNGINTSFSEMMALPDSQLDMAYWLPWYNNLNLDSQLRIASVSDQSTTVHVYISGTEIQDSPFTLPGGTSTRISVIGVNDGPVQIVSDQNIVVSERVIYKLNKMATSFSEMMGLPQSQLDTTYWLPWYNNVYLDTQLRFGAP